MSRSPVVDTQDETHWSPRTWPEETTVVPLAIDETTFAVWLGLIWRGTPSQPATVVSKPLPPGSLPCGWFDTLGVGVGVGVGDGLELGLGDELGLGVGVGVGFGVGVGVGALDGLGVGVGVGVGVGSCEIESLKAPVAA
jgi:hypothetical protein